MLKITKEELEELIEKAKKGLKSAYAPRSNFPTGAAVLTDKGNIYQGCNVESVISGMGTCAERCAIDNAIANGEYCFKAIIVITKLENPVITHNFDILTSMNPILIVLVLFGLVQYLAR